jgi:uncharacterized protein (DUF302 family)
MRSINSISALFVCSLLLAACGNDDPLSPERYAQSDALFAQLEENVSRSSSLSKVVEIDHSRMGAQVGSNMPPARVLIFSDSRLETEFIKRNQLMALDLPLRVLAYEPAPGADSKVIYNSLAYLELRYEIGFPEPLEQAFDASISVVLKGIDSSNIASFERDNMPNDAIINIASPFDFATTLAKVQAAIDGQDDTVNFGAVDFTAQAREIGESINPTTLILFGAPGPGAKAMNHAPTLGLDAFCQKFLVWQDENQRVFLSYNNLLTLADRQGVKKSIPLRFINKRLNQVFEEALAD